MPQVGVKGTPSLTVKMVPSSQPSVSQRAGPEKDLAVGMSQVPLMTSVRLTLKSESPRVSRMSNQFRLEMELPKASPASGGGTGVDALAPSKGALHLEAMAHALGQLHFEGVEVRASLIKHRRGSNRNWD